MNEESQRSEKREQGRGRGGVAKVKQRAVTRSIIAGVSRAFVIRNGTGDALCLRAMDAAIDGWPVVGTSLGPRSGKVTKVAGGQHGARACRTGLDPGSSEGSHVGRKEKHPSRLCALCVDGVGIVAPSRVSFSSPQ
jgi:hypothetical protein